GRMSRVGIPGGLLCLGLAAMARSQVPQPPESGTAAARATLLAPPVFETPPDLKAPDSPSRRPRRLDPGVRLARLMPQDAGAARPGAEDGGQPLPSVAPLPSQDTQGPQGRPANPPGSPAMQGRAQPGATARPAPPGARVPAGPQARTPQSRSPQAQPPQPRTT